MKVVGKYPTNMKGDSQWLRCTLKRLKEGVNHTHLGSSGSSHLLPLAQFMGRQIKCKGQRCILQEGIRLLCILH